MTANELPPFSVRSDTKTVSLNQATLLSRIRDSRITDRTPVKKLKPVVTVGQSTFARRGDFSVITGQRKAGKTTILQFVVATALLEDIPLELDTLQIRTEYCRGNDVVYVDTEGSKEDTQDFIKGVKSIIGKSEQPANLHTYHWREFTAKECREGMDILFDEHPNAHIWIIDGIADLVSKPNDEEESNQTVRWIMSMAGKLDTCIILVIHENPTKAGQESKLRGHLGSELERKASGAVGIEKDRQRGEHYIKSRFLRKSADFEPIAFRFDPHTNRPTHRVLTASERAQLQDKNRVRIGELMALRAKCYRGTTSRTERELKESIKHQNSTTGKDAERALCNRNVQALLKYNLIREEQTADGYVYHLTDIEGGSIDFKIGQSDE
ncbi:AAA family ATPase [uncultured Spirosoma sp.]|uniref:AAA family ATPase n=1 Tax=uncultured Spirosoma sp. TaxID=278208 RepID=UPI0025879169|nr:AAA family ATPase [uncultured Spirosoma sp.]